MLNTSVQLLLADDDADDCELFSDALHELDQPAGLTVVHDGEQLMSLLDNVNEALPDILFLDLNMPRKNGFECLSEIRNNFRFKDLPVIICSTSLETNIVDKLFSIGATHYIRKPGDYNALKTLLRKAISVTANTGLRSAMSDFVLQP